MRIGILFIILFFWNELHAQNIECGHDYLLKTEKEPKSKNEVHLLLEHVPVVLGHEDIIPIHLKFQVTSAQVISSVVCRLYDYCQGSFINVDFYDNGQGVDFSGGDNIYTSGIPICYNEVSPFDVNFELDRLRTTVTLTDGSEHKFLTRLGSYSINSDKVQFDNSIQISEIKDQNIFYTDHIANVVLPRSYDPLFQDFDRHYVYSIINEMWGNDNDFILLTATFFDTNLSTNSFSAFYVSSKDVIQTFGDFSNNLINHELNHKWVNGLNSFGLSANNGHWGFIERDHSAFGQGCFTGSFKSIFLENGSVKYNLQNSLYDKFNYFNDLELALMGLSDFEQVEFPIKYCLNPDYCGNDGFTGGSIGTMAKEDFLDFVENKKPATISDTLNFKFVFLSDKRMSDLEMRFLDSKVMEYVSFYKASTEGLGTLNVNLEVIEETIIDSDDDGFDASVDCNDMDPTVHPNAVEIANNGIDEDCDGIALVIDEDGDGHNSDEDCDDNASEINSDANEIANNDIDENCDGIILMIDQDGDGYNSDEDCNDENPNINPQAEEILNNLLDENCDGIVEIIDLDGDGFHSDEDCDDNNPLVHPGALEILGNVTDENCDGDLLYEDKDGDGFSAPRDCNDNDASINPSALEIYNNNIDEDCDGCNCKYLTKEDGN